MFKSRLSVPDAWGRVGIGPSRAFWLRSIVVRVAGKTGSVPDRKFSERSSVVAEAGRLAKAGGMEPEKPFSESERVWIALREAIKAFGMAPENEFPSKFTVVTDATMVPLDHEVGMDPRPTLERDRVLREFMSSSSSSPPDKSPSPSSRVVRVVMSDHVAGNGPSNPTSFKLTDSTFWYS